MFFDQADKILLCVPAQGRRAEVSVGGKIVFWRGIEVGKITAPTPGHKYLLAGPVAALEYQYTPPSAASGDGTHKTGSTCTKNNDVVVLH
jgi:hypothetical protein